MDQREADQFRQISTLAQIEKSQLVISQYRLGIEFQRSQILKNTRLLGRIAERLGEPDEEEDP